MKTDLKAPFPYFGGKSTISHMVWEALGDVKHYIEPFFGSGAVLLSRRGYDPSKHTETICDKDGFIANVWRALQFAPDTVARWCDWPVNHVDLSARKMSLIANEARLMENLISDPEWYDAKMAGYWIWAASCWIGSGMTSIGQRPHVGHAGMGIHAIGQKPHVGHAEEKKGVQDAYNVNIFTWFRRLSERLRNVRVVCGDWTKVCGGNWQSKMGMTGIFFDPPYSDENRTKCLYHCESLTVSKGVREWAIARANDPSYRIVIAGYYEEHESLLSQGWDCYNWKTMGGYANISRNKSNNKNKNRFRETLFFSPHCIKCKLF